MTKDSNNSKNKIKNNKKYYKQEDEIINEQDEENYKNSNNNDNNNSDNINNKTNTKFEKDTNFIEASKEIEKKKEDEVSSGRYGKIIKNNLKAKEHPILLSPHSNIGSISNIQYTTSENSTPKQATPTPTSTTTANSLSSLNTSSSLGASSSGVLNTSNENTPIIGGVLKIDNEILLNSGHKKVLPLFNLICLTICFLGVQFGWALQIAFSTPLFLELGVEQKWVSYIWLAGPISGLIVQPLVGVITDRSECRFGRRKPFILIGSIFISIGLALISNAESIGSYLGDNEQKKTVAISIAIIGFWILDLSNNAVQAPCRALLVDIAAPSQQSLGSSLFSLMLGTGNLLGYMMGSIDLVRMVPFMKTDTRALFTLSIMVLMFCVIMTLGFVTEEQYIRVNDDRPIENPLKTMFKGIIKMPTYLQRLCVVQFFSWIGWFSFVLFITTWVGVNVFGGDPNAPEYSDSRILFQDGVRWGSLALTVSSGMTIAISLLIPFLVKFVDMKYIYIGGNLLQCIFFALFYFIDSKIGSILLIAATGIPWAVVMILPFSIVGMGVEDNESSGLNIGTLNIFVVVPQMVVSLGIGLILDLSRGNVVYSLLTGSVASFFATLFCFRIIIPKHHGHPIGDIEEIHFNIENNNGGNNYSPMHKSSESNQSRIKDNINKNDGNNNNKNNNNMNYNYIQKDIEPILNLNDSYQINQNQESFSNDY
ncbi:hypothetical protein RB653_002938 [Dictyostelium firmibasis]|uniref:Uncharacterized protein n=1 Tax=Dictyostelium firmibasis TaxID=79012 RepID=A0AAN7TZ43_9MYCE